MNAVLLWTSVANAQPSGPSADSTRTPASRRREAAVRYDRAVRLYEDGDYKLALVEFRRAYELDPSWQVLYNIGEVNFQLHNYADARRALEQYLELGGGRIGPERRAHVEKELEELRIRTAYLSVHVEPPDADVSLDGEHVQYGDLSRHLVDAGSHDVVVSKTGYKTSTRRIEVAGGDDKSLRVALAKADARPLTVTTSSVPGFVWIGWGITAALAAGTAGSFVGWQSAQSTLADVKRRQTTRAELDDQVRTVDTWSTATWSLAAGTALAAGISLYFTLRGSTHSGPRTPDQALRVLTPLTF